MTRMGVAQRIVAEKTVVVLLVRGEDPDGGRVYAYVALRADRLEEFMDAQKAGTFFPADYGIVLAGGSGEPPPEVRERMTREYGFNHEAMRDIPDSEDASGLVQNLSKIARPS
jgi:hypothetical protein